jgi:ketosteroid isomerase-like protein
MTSKERNVATLKRFYDRFRRLDKEGFLEVWAEQPVVEIPFTPPGIPQSYRTPEAFKAFWDPIFQYRGKFDWTIDELIVGDDPDVVVALTRSDVDVVTPGGPIQFRGKYVHLFRFHNGKVKEWREYLDTAFVCKVYGFS